jgi:mRNA interferase MazF
MNKIIEQLDIYWINFDPSVGHEVKKIRPAIVIQDHFIAPNAKTFLVCPITASDNINPLDVALTCTDLKPNSRARITQLKVCDIDRFQTKIGRITKEEFETIFDNFLFLVGK